MVPSKEEKKEDKKEVKMDVKKEEKTQENRNKNVFGRVKERLSMRSTKKKKKGKCPEAKANTVKENDISEQKIDEHSNKKKSDITNAKSLEKEETKTGEKKKKGNILERLFKIFSFGSQKRQEISATTTDIEQDKTTEEKESNKDMKLQDDIKHCSITSLEDLEISALCGDGDEDLGTSPSTPVISSSRPPLPSTRKPPSSATTAHTRPVSQLDAALQQFKLSTAASRENLRGSRVDISKVKTLVTSRPSTPTTARWRSRAPPENTNLTDQWKKLSASMTDLR
jgi:hypothetical protein